MEGVLLQFCTPVPSGLSLDTSKYPLKTFQSVSLTGSRNNICTIEAATVPRRYFLEGAGISWLFGYILIINFSEKYNRIFDT